MLAQNSLVKDVNMPTPKYLAHVSIVTNENYEKMVTFYGDLLNMRTIVKLDGRVRMHLMGFDEEHHRVGILKLPVKQKGDSQSTGWEHSSYSYASLEDLFTLIKMFHQKSGVWPYFSAHQGPIIAVSYKDPDGNRVEVITDVLGSQEEIIEYLQVRCADPSFNTLLPFDIRKMIDLHDGGVPIDDLKQYESVVKLLAEGAL